jgi:hypothetical protein
VASKRTVAVRSRTIRVPTLQATGLADNAAQWMMFRPEILDELARHGLRAGPDTSAARLREQINDLYRFEIRKLRDQCRAGDIPVRDLATHVAELRRRYLLLSIPIENWIESQPPVRKGLP